MSDTNLRYAVCCTSCGHIEDRAWEPATSEAHSYQTTKPLTAQGHVPIYCMKCGNRKWERPATKEQLEAFDTRRAREARAIELTAREDFDGMFKIPDEIRASPEVKRALGNLFGPLEGETLKQAQANCLKVARSGMQGDSLAWIDYYDRAIQKAVAANKKAA